MIALGDFETLDWRNVRVRNGSVYGLAGELAVVGIKANCGRHGANGNGEAERTKKLLEAGNRL
jgi:hypothetical protein